MEKHIMTISEKVAFLRDYFSDIPNVMVHFRAVYFGYHSEPTEEVFKRVMAEMQFTPQYMVV